MRSLFFICAVVAAVFVVRSHAESQSSACVNDGSGWVCNDNRNPGGGPSYAYGVTNGQDRQVYAGQGPPPPGAIPNFGFPGFQNFPGFANFPGFPGFMYGRR